MQTSILNRILYVFAGIGISTFLLFILSFQFEKNKLLDNDPETYPQNYQIITPDFPERLSIFGESIPMEDIEIRERIEREFIVNTYWHSATLLLIKRANRWFPIIEPVLERNNIPNDFKYVSMIESNLENSISPKGATGFWQFMEDTAPKYGLEISGEVDERYHIEKSTEAACKYILEAKEKFGTWTLAAASYNMGQNGVAEQLERQKTDSYYGLLLNDETARYIARIISMKIISNNYEKYGFNISPDQLYPPIETYDFVINDKVEHFADFAHEHGIDYRTLKFFNPWLRENYLTNSSKKEYIIKLPVDNNIFIKN